MKFITSILLTALAGYAVCAFSVMPWWAFVITSFIVALAIAQKPWKAFVAGFLGTFLLWFSLELFFDLNNNGILSTRIANVLPLSGNKWLLMVICAFIGGLLSSFAALSGSLLRKK